MFAQGFDVTLENDIKPKQKNNTKSNMIAIILYALAIAAALGLNDLILTIFNKLNLTQWGEIVTKIIYVVLIFGAALVLAYYTQSTVPV